MPKFNLAIDWETGEGTVTIFDDGTVSTLDNDHPNFLRIARGLTNREDVSHLLSLESAVTRIDDRVSIVDNTLQFDGEPVHNNLTSTIVRYAREGRDTTGLVKFLELLNTNPSRRSREQLFDWTQSVDLTIDQDGYIIGYKGLYPRPESLDDSEFPIEDYPWQSSHSGSTIVDGIPHVGQTPAGIGAVIEMPREEVQDDPTQGCSFGLHVGNYSYASGWASVLVEVKFSPADVVSVPTDSSFAKLRCCRYEVVAEHERELGDDLSEWEPDGEDWDDDEAFDDLASVIPPTFLERLKSRFGSK